MSKNFKTLETLNRIDPLHWCVIYEPGMRGNSLVRILCAHDESWWVNDLMNQHLDEDIKSPIQFSENQSSFRCYWPDLKMGFLTTHNYLEIDEKNEILLDIMKKRGRYLDKLFFTHIHPQYLNYQYPSKYIHVYASSNNSKRKYFSREPKSSETAFNIDISMLFSYDRLEFENEYCKILNYFDFTPKFTSVRNFILNLLDREDYIQKSLLYEGLETK